MVASKGCYYLIKTTYIKKTCLLSIKGSETSSETRPLTYIPVTSSQTAHTRPVVILGDLKDNLTEDLLTDFPDSFGTCIPRK